MLLPLLAYVFLEGFAGGLAYSALAPFAKSLGLSPLDYGLATMLITLTDTMTSILWGVAADKFSVRKLLALGSLSYLSAFVLVQTGTKPAFFLACSLVGVVAGMGPAVYAYVGRVARRKELAYGELGASLTLGAALGGLTASFLKLGYGKIFTIGALASAASLAFPPLMKEVELEKRKVELRIPKGALPFAVYEALTALGSAAGIWMLDYYFVKKFGVGSSGIGLFVAVNEVVIALGTVTGPALSKKFGTVRTFFLVTALGTIITPLIALAPNFYASVAFAAARAFFMNAGGPLLQAMVSEVVPEEALGRAFGVLNLSWSLGASFGRVLGGAMMEFWLDLPVYFSALAYGTGLLVLAKAEKAEVPSFPGYKRRR